MNVKEMEAFLAFMEGGSIAEASRRLYRTQPQISRLLSGLEADIGVTLFSRKRRHLVPTDVAQDLYPEIHRALGRLFSIKDFAQRIVDQKGHHVRVLTAPQVTEAVIADAIAIMTQEDKEFTASLDSRSRININLWLSRESFDIAITVLPIENQTVEIESLAKIEAVAVISESHPLATRNAVDVEDLVEYPLIATSTRSIIRQRLDNLIRQAGIAPKIALETPNGVIACQLAERGLGIAIADGFIARSNHSPHLVIRRFKPTIELNYVLLYPKGLARSATIRRLANLICLSASRQTKELGQILQSNNQQ